MKRLLLSLSTCICLYANEINEVTTTSPSIPESTTQNTIFTLNLEYIKSIPKGIKRDFFINEYFKSDITSEQSYEALALLENMTNEIFNNFAKSYKDDETLAVSQCMNMQIKDLVYSYGACIVNGIDLKIASSLSAVELQQIYQKTIEKYPTFAKEINILSSSIPFTKLIVQKEKQFYDIFLGVTDEFREKYFDYRLPSRTFERVFQNKNRFQEFLKVVVKNQNLKILNKSFLKIDDSVLDFNSSFYLGLNAIQFKDYNKAFKYLENAKNKANNIYDIDKINFYLFHITKNQSFLRDLASSSILSIYSYYAKEFLKIKQNYFLEKFDFIDKLLDNNSKQRLAFIYAFSKTYSDFDSKNVSKNLKVGLMQLDANFTSHIENKDLLANYSILDLFDSAKNIAYSNMILDTYAKSNNSILSLYFKYIGKERLLKIVSNKKFIEDLDFYSFSKYFDKKDEEFILSYILYFNSLEKDDNKKIKLSSIFENLLKPNLKQDEKALD